MYSREYRPLSGKQQIRQKRVTARQHWVKCWRPGDDNVLRCDYLYGIDNAQPPLLSLSASLSLCCFFCCCHPRCLGERKRWHSCSGVTFGGGIVRAARKRRKEATWCWRGRDLTINMRWGEREGHREIDNDDDRGRRGAVCAKTGGKGWQGDNNGDNCGRGSHVSVIMNAPPHATKFQFQDLQRQTAMPEPPLHGEEVWREGKMMQNMYCSYPMKVDL